ncbi:hypothetical protein J2S43_007377 [Catenuloplanes nepalensis]|uniref:Uncharacterized protein n=1 Tax=Catenuloplanes nepalensis TaxID=587533 RepID=A0ABT9N577_9ACTN|nr:hypothetical protein [Catenuloplanes nepalensis]MDP9798865.1 hypothetical protein [Catenuloplanes nepalensis]
MAFRTRNFARLCAATALAAGATGFFAAPAFAAPSGTDFSIVTNDITGPDGAPLAPGASSEVITTITNVGDEVITGFTLSVTLPESVSFKNQVAAEFCSYEGQTVTCTFDDGWALVPAGQEDPENDIYSGWEVPFEVTVAADAKGPVLDGGKSSGEISYYADLETGVEKDADTGAVTGTQFEAASFSESAGTFTTVSYKTAANVKTTGGKGHKGDKDKWKQKDEWSKGHNCGHPPKPPKPPKTPTPTPSNTGSPSPSTPTSPSPSPSLSASPSPSPSLSPSASPSPSPSNPTSPSPSPSLPTTIQHEDEFVALVAVPGGNGGGEPGLPVTGPQTAIIGGVGAAVLVGGAVVFMMARRRKVVTVTPGDGNSAL